jgi:hypothetical protein
MTEKSVTEAPAMTAKNPIQEPKARPWLEALAIEWSNRTSKTDDVTEHGKRLGNGKPFLRVSENQLTAERMVTPLASRYLLAQPVRILLVASPVR